MATKKTKSIVLNKPEKYLNRELSLIEFNRRVLLEAEGKQHPLLERLKFICILSSNLDEFFMIRVAGLKSQIAAGVNDLSYDGQTASQQLKEIRNRLIPIYQQQEDLFNKDIIPNLRKEGIFIHRYNEITINEKKSLNKYFLANILPVLTPLVIDSAHPFPRLNERSLNIAFVLNDNTINSEESKLAFLQVPNLFPRFVEINRKSGHHYVLLESIIKENASHLFPGMEVADTNTFRVTRDADIEIADDEAEDLLQEIEEQIKQRKWNRSAVRLEVSNEMPLYLVDLLRDSLDLEDEDIYRLDRPLKFTDFMQLTKLDLPHLKDKPFYTRIPPQFKGKGIFEAIKKGDIFVHHPFDSFSKTTTRFLNQASEDPNVLAIKITLYRTEGNSQIIEALKNAAENGKDVLAFVELKARFDEENNIIWARQLEQAGVHVVYGVLGLKTHSKIAMVVRREGKKLKTYLHLGTGNYNNTTARLYTDMAIFTDNPDFGEDALHLFNYLTGYSKYGGWKELGIAPTHLADKTLAMINREAEKHTEENPGLIVAKMNQLAQKDVINALYKASQKGVKIKLMVRGVCCLKPGVEGLSENIEIRSVIGRFLEHTRFFYFKNGGEEEYYISSADWMTRNLHKRVEVMTPIHSKKIRKQLDKIIEYYWKDNTKSWKLLADGSYEKIKPKSNEKRFSAQTYLLGIFNRSQER